jgi:hypothetical protein
MATAQQPISGPQIIHHLPKKPIKAIAIKTGWYGASGVGKTFSAAMLALGLSKEEHDGAPVWVTDSEDGWKFLKPVFAMEKVELVIRKVPTFLGMLTDLRDAERAGACVWNVDSLTTIFREWLKACQTKCGFNGQWGSEMRDGWTAFVQTFLRSAIHCQALGRIKDVEEEMIVDDDGNTKRLKTGDKLNAGGKESFTFEPHLCLRLERERKDRVKKGLKLEGEGRVVHRVDVEKDRALVLNNKILRWNSLSGYKPGGYREVWTSLRAHFIATQSTGDFSTIDTSQTSELLVNDGAASGEFYERRARREKFCAEIKACMDLFFGGRGGDDVKMRIAISDLIFGVKSREAADALPLEKLERGLRILQGFERNVAPPVGMPSSREEILITLAEAIKEYDSGTAQLNDLPF